MNSSVQEKDVFYTNFLNFIFHVQHIDKLILIGTSILGWITITRSGIVCWVIMLLNAWTPTACASFLEFDLVIVTPLHFSSGQMLQADTSDTIGRLNEHLKSVFKHTKSHWWRLYSSHFPTSWNTRTFFRANHARSLGRKYISSGKVTRKDAISSEIYKHGGKNIIKKATPGGLLGFLKITRMP